MSDKKPEYEQTRDYHMAREEIRRMLTEIGKMRGTIARISGILDDHQVIYERADDEGQPMWQPASRRAFLSYDAESDYEITQDDVTRILAKLGKMRGTVARLTDTLDGYLLCCECGRHYEHHRFGGDCKQDREFKEYVERAIEELRHLITKGEEDENPEYLRGACEIIANLWCEHDVADASYIMMNEIMEKGGLA